MPQMGVSVAEGTIVKWHKQPGDWVEADETVCEISTDKIDTEMPSPASGRLVRILVEENETVAVGTVLARDRHRRAAGSAARRPSAERRAGRTERRTGPLARDLAGRAAGRGRARHRPVAGDRAPASAGASARRTCSRSSSKRRRRTERPLHTESPYRPEPSRPTADATRRRAARAAVADAQADRRAHAPQPAHRGARDDGRRGGHEPRGRAPRGS